MARNQIEALLIGPWPFQIKITWHFCVIIFRDKLTLAVLKLRESGDLKYMQKKWWDERSECPAPSSSQVELCSGVLIVVTNQA